MHKVPKYMIDDVQHGFKYMQEIVSSYTDVMRGQSLPSKDRLQLAAAQEGVKATQLSLNTLVQMAELAKKHGAKGK